MNPKELSLGSLQSVESRYLYLSKNDQNDIATKQYDELHLSRTKRLMKNWKLIFVITMPLLTLMFVSALILSQSSNNLKKTMIVIESIGAGMDLSELVIHLQRERGVSANYLSSVDSLVVFSKEFERLQRETNQSAMIVNWQSDSMIVNSVKMTTEDFFVSIQDHRNAVGSKTIDVIFNLNFYTMIITSLMKYITKSVLSPANTDVQKLLVANRAILSWTDVVGIQRTLGTNYFTDCEWPSVDSGKQFMELIGKAMALYNTASSYASNIETSFNNKMAESNDLSLFVDSLQNFSLFQNYKLHCSNLSFAKRIDQGKSWFFNMTKYIDTLFCIREETILKIKTILQKVRSEFILEFCIFLTTFAITSIASIILTVRYINCIDEVTGNLSKYVVIARNQSEALIREKKRTENLLYQMLPRKVANALKRGLLSPAEHFEDVSVLFSDIVDFTSICTISEPMEIMAMLNDLYSLFDDSLRNYNIYKVETIGDVYMVTSGVPVSNRLRHAPEIAMFAIKIRQKVRHYKISHMPGRILNLRIGVHSGACVAGIVGTKMPRYCLFGDTVNIASRMVSCGIGGKIHISRSTNIILKKDEKFSTEYRGITYLKGKGPMPTYWLEECKVKSEQADDRVKYDKNTNL